MRVTEMHSGRERFATLQRWTSARAVVATLAALALSVAAPTTARASQILEPVFDFVPGFGADTNVLPTPLPGAINGATGLPFITADEPGEIITYPAGFPADPVLINTV